MKIQSFKKKINEFHYNRVSCGLRTMYISGRKTNFVIDDISNKGFCLSVYIGNNHRFPDTYIIRYLLKSRYENSRF